MQTTFEALGRGLSNARANWELILVQLVQVVAVTILLLLGIVPLFLALGAETLAAIPQDTAEIAGWIEGLVSGARIGAVVVGVASLLAIWLGAMLVYCYFQAGLLGIVVSAEHQAPLGSVSEARLFRTFRMADFLGWSRRHAWRLFWFFGVVGALALAGAVLVALAIGAIAYAGSRFGAGSAAAIGCISAIPGLFGVMVLSLWVFLAQVELVRPEAGFWKAQRRALDVLGRRLGAALLIWLAWLGFSLLLGLGFGIVSLAAELGFAGSAVAKAMATLTLTVMQSLLSAALTLCMIAACAALARSVSTPPPVAAGGVPDAVTPGWVV